MDRLEEYARKNGVPIMMKDGIEFLIKLIHDNDVKSVLELGTAIGYSSIRMCLSKDDLFVTSIERDPKMYSLALSNISDFKLDDRINVIFGDALDVDVDGMFDLIFIDAAKAQYIRFFEKYKNNLASDGLIVTDNLNFHGLSEKEESIKSKDLRGLVRKINNFHRFLIDNKEFETKFYQIGDGISVSKRRKEV